METTVKQRLIYFIKSKGFSQGRFEKRSWFVKWVCK